jgi:hypothetical protein
MFETVDAAKKAITAHAACAQFVVIGSHWIVYFPDEYFPGGYSANKAGDDLAELNELYRRVDAFWTARRK